MKDFYALYDHLKYLYESGLYEDVKVLADLLIGLVESTSPSLTGLLASMTGSVDMAAALSSAAAAATSSTATLTSGSSTMLSAAPTATMAGSSSAVVGSMPNATPVTTLTACTSAALASNVLMTPAAATTSSGAAGVGQQQANMAAGVKEPAAVPSQFDLKDIYTVYHLFGNSAFHLKEYRLAENLYNKALQINRTSTRSSKLKNVNQVDSDTDIEIKYNLHLCLVYDKKQAEAAKILESIPSRQRSLKVLLALAKLSQALMHTKEAIAYYKEVLKISKFSIVAIEALLNMGVKLDELPKAAVAANSEWLNMYLKGKSNLINREYKEAIKTFKTIDSNFMHKSMEVLCSLAHSYYLNGDYSNSLSSFEKLHKLEPTYTTKMDVYAYLLYSDKSDYDKLSTLERLANDMHQTSINIPETWTVIGYYSLKKKSQKAKCFAENALLIDRENAQALLLKAIALGKLKAVSDSAVAYREATRVNIYFYEAYKGLVEALLNLNHIKDAIQMAANSIKLLGSNHRTLALYGEALSRDSATQEKSKTYLYKAIKGDPDNQEAVVCLVRVCMTLSQYHEALDVLGKYIRHNSSNPRLMHIYSELMKKCNKTDEAVIYMNKASGMDPNNIQIKTMLERSEQSIESNQDETIQNFHVI